MSGTGHWTRIVLAMMVGVPVAAAQPNTPAPVFRPVLGELRTKVQIPVLLPSTLPVRLRSPEIGDVVLLAAAADSYSVDLRYKGVGGDAGFAAWFHGARSGPDAVHAKHPYRLANGALAAFNPVRCGGSCAPASLSWRQDDAVYTIEIALPSDMAPRAQAKVLVETADAMVRLRREVEGPPQTHRRGAPPGGDYTWTPNESLHRMGANGPPYEWLANSFSREHHRAWKVGAHR